MIRCRHEVIELAVDKKDEDSRELPVIAPCRLSFEDLLARDEQRWTRIEGAAELRRVADRVQRELQSGELRRFVAWVCRVHGAGLARAAGLPIAPLRVELAS
jgi:hypothetical protein